MIRTIIIPHKDSISVAIPKDYVGKQLEVIVFSKDEGLTENNVIKKQATFSALTIDTRGFKFSRDEANER